MRGGLAMVVAVGLFACSGEPELRTPGSARTRQGLDDLAAYFHQELTSGESSRISALLLSNEDLDAQFDISVRMVFSEQLRNERRHVGGTTATWGRFAGSRYQGFCARGARVLETGERGLRAGTEAVDELLIVGIFAGSEWAGWLRDIIRTSHGFRMAKLPSDTPRAGHPELDMWSCEVAVRPGERGRRSPGQR